MRGLASLLVLALLCSAAVAADNPDWAYPVTPPPPSLDNAVLKTVPGSSKQYTQAQIDDPFNPPDWFPDEHPPMPEVVAREAPDLPPVPAHSAISPLATATQNQPLYPASRLPTLFGKWWPSRMESVPVGVRR